MEYTDLVSAVVFYMSVHTHTHTRMNEYDQDGTGHLQCTNVSNVPPLSYTLACYSHVNGDALRVLEGQRTSCLNSHITQQKSKM